MIAEHHIHIAELSDARQIAGMSRDYIEHGLPWGWTQARVTQAIRDPAINVAVVRERSAVVGFGIMNYTDDDAHLLLLAVRTDRRRMGIASALLLWLEAAARAAGASRIRVEARWQNDAARCFYSEHAYCERAIKRRMYSSSVDGVLLEKWLRRDA